MCSEQGVRFVNNDNTFYLNDGSVNEAYMLHDGKNLNSHGTNRLCKNLKLPIKHNIVDVTRIVSEMKTAPLTYPPPGYNQGLTTKTPPLMSLPPMGFHHMKHQRRTQGDSRGYNHKCHFCSEPGHTASVCRHGKPIQCKSCLQMGHKSKFCSK